MPSRLECVLRPMTCYTLHLTPLVSDRVVEPSAEKDEERFFRKLFIIAIQVEAATKRPHAPAGGVPDYVQRYLERFLAYVC